LPNHSLETLPLLGEEISQLLISQRPSVVPIEHLPMIYFAKYGKSLFVTDFKPEVQQLGEKGSYSLICLLMRLDTIKVIERFHLILCISAIFLSIFIYHVA
jgi:hypothetical protein